MRGRRPRRSMGLILGYPRYKKSQVEMFEMVCLDILRGCLATGETLSSSPKQPQSPVQHEGKHYAHQQHRGDRDEDARRTTLECEVAGEVAEPAQTFGKDEQERADPYKRHTK